MSKKTYHSTTKKMDHYTGYAMTAPAIILLTIFVYIPLGMAIQKSFTDWKFYGESSFVGVQNYIMVLKNQLFQTSIINIIWFTIIIIPLELILSFLFAHVLKNMSEYLGPLVKTAVYVPTVIAGVVASVIFLFIFNYQGGIINYAIRMLGGKRVAFFNDPMLSRICIGLTTLWMGFGYNSLVMYAGLMNIPQAYYEAAEVDGATTWKKLSHITLPSIKNVFILILVNLTTTTLQMFDLPYMMTQGGPVNTTLTPMMFIYNNFKSVDYSMGYTVSAALLMMIVIGLLSSVVFRLIGSEKSQDE